MIVSTAQQTRQKVIDGEWPSVDLAVFVAKPRAPSDRVNQR